MPIAIAIKPLPDKGGVPDDQPDDNGVGQDIVDQCKALGEDDLTTLIHGIGPDALAVLEKIPELKALADYLGNGDASSEDPALNPAPPPPADVRSSVASAMKANGVRGY